MNYKKLKVALGVLSGRIDAKNITSSQLSLLGWDWYCPNAYELKEKAEEIVLEHFELLFGSVIIDEEDD